MSWCFCGCDCDVVYSLLVYPFDSVTKRLVVGACCGIM